MAWILIISLVDPVGAWAHSRKAIKMKTMKSIPALLGLAILPLFLTQCMVLEYDSRLGNGISTLEVRRLNTFSRVDLDCPLHVTLKSGSEYAAYVTSDGNLSHAIETNTFAGVLTISLSGEIEPVITPEIVIVVPNINSVIHNGNGLIEILEGGDFPNLDLQLNGSGEIRFAGTASHLNVELNGSGQMFLEGFAADIKVDLRGNGDVHAENLLTEAAEVNLSGSGNIYLDLDYESSLDLVLTGSGKVEWWGAPEHIKYTLTGSGKVVEHRGLPKKAASAKKSAATGKSYDSPSLDFKKS
jgi:Putative auto-transporter adhesin, head GIN domain